MNISIKRVGNSIASLRDYKDIDSRGELAHVIAELESIKKDLLAMWENFND